jgi:hypothetical protein
LGDIGQRFGGFPYRNNVPSETALKTDHPFPIMSAIDIFDNKGRVLITFDYRGEVDFSIPDTFMNHLQVNDLWQAPPVFRVDEWTYIFITRACMYFFIVTLSNSSIALLLVFLDSLPKLFAEYLDSDLCPELIVDNFTLIYELLDEVMDFWYPQTLDSKSLSAYILREKPKDPTRQPKEVPELEPTGRSRGGELASITM